MKAIKIFFMIRTIHLLNSSLFVSCVKIKLMGSAVDIEFFVSSKGPNQVYFHIDNYIYIYIIIKENISMCKQNISTLLVEGSLSLSLLVEVGIHNGRGGNGSPFHEHQSHKNSVPITLWRLWAWWIRFRHTRSTAYKRKLDIGVVPTNTPSLIPMYRES